MLGASCRAARRRRKTRQEEQPRGTRPSTRCPPGAGPGVPLTSPPGPAGGRACSCRRVCRGPRPALLTRRRRAEEAHKRETRAHGPEGAAGQLGPQGGLTSSAHSGACLSAGREAASPHLTRGASPQGAAILRGAGGPAFRRSADLTGPAPAASLRAGTQAFAREHSPERPRAAAAERPLRMRAAGPRRFVEARSVRRRCGQRSHGDSDAAV